MAVAVAVAVMVVMVTVGMAAARAAVVAALYNYITYCRQTRPLARLPKETQKKSLDAAVA